MTALNRPIGTAQLMRATGVSIGTATRFIKGLPVTPLHFRLLEAAAKSIGVPYKPPPPFKAKTDSAEET